jgi:hypothetical protein
MYIKLNQTSSDNQYDRVFVEIKRSVSSAVKTEVFDHIDTILDDTGGRPHSLISEIDTDVEQVLIQDTKPELPEKEKKENREPYSGAGSVSQFILYSDGTIETPEYFFR